VGSIRSFLLPFVSVALVAACASDAEPDAPTFRGSYYAQADGPIAQLAFYDGGHYGLRRNEPCAPRGEGACFEAGTYTVDARAAALQLAPYTLDHGWTLPFVVTEKAEGDDLVATRSLAPLTDRPLVGSGPTVTSGQPLTQGQVTTFRSGQQLLSATGVQLLCSDPPMGNCEFYEQCLERAHPCGANGYPMGYGRKYCQRYFDNIERFSPQGQQWIRYVGNCLQRQLVPYTDPSRAMSCSTLMSTAFSSHVGCYLNGPVSICDLPIRDKWTIMTSVIDARDLANVQTAVVGSICASQLICPNGQCPMVMNEELGPLGDPR
jgi:hypothetical protein